MVDQNNNGTPPPFDPNGQNEGNGDLDVGKPAVASAPSRIFTVIGAGAAFFALIIYFVVFGGGGGEQVPTGKSSIPASKISNKVAPLPPPPPPDTEPPPPTIIGMPSSSGGAPMPQIPTPPIVKEDEPTDESRLARIRSNMVVFGGSGSSRDKDKKEDCMSEASSLNDPNSAFACKVEKTGAKRAIATRIGRLENIITQGKMIHAVMETAINTQLPGSIRAITSRDTYGEGGEYPLIPKGSRLIGVYNTEVTQGQARVFVVWNRIIRPDGIDVALESPGTDQLGRAGLAGAVDNRFPQIFTTAILSSIVTIGMAYGADQIGGDEQNTTTQNPDGSTTTTSNATTQAAAEAATRVGGTVERTLDRIIDTRPIISVDQGTRINVFVNQDLIFPPSVAGSAYTVP